MTHRPASSAAKTKTESNSAGAAFLHDHWLTLLRPQPTSVSTFQRKLLNWYKKVARDLPWRQSQLHYPVLVSEMMLQQTTVSTVLRFFPKFMSKFPDVHQLAAADLQDVLHAWEGLGYYRRARFLHECARVVAQQLAGEFPNTRQALEQLPGVGKYTASALASICSNQPVGVLEANTVRVWARLSAKSNPHETRTLQELWKLADSAVSVSQPGAFNQAMMELGAIICSIDSPKCNQCPVSSHCAAYQTGTPAEFGRPKERAPIKLEQHACVLLCSENAVLLSQRRTDEPWAELWELPRVVLAAEQDPGTMLIDYLRERLNRSARDERLPVQIEASPIASLKHAIMQSRVTLTCYRGICRKHLRLPSDSRLQWVPIAELSTKPLSSPQRKLLHKLSPYWANTSSQISSV